MIPRSKLVLTVLIIIETLHQTSFASLNFGGYNRNRLLPKKQGGTLDKVRIIRGVASDKCLVIEAGQRQGVVRESQLVLWNCHDREIKGLEKEMFSVSKAHDGGYLLIGNAGAQDKCVAAENGYNDHVVTRRCDSLKENQLWLLRRIDASKNMYQLVQKSSGRCMRAPGMHNGAWVRVGDCDYQDSRQLWEICSLMGDCNI